MISDPELLRQYAEQRDEAAFAEVVRRQADLVYSVALRVTENAALAQDVTQTVFTKLAQQARVLGRYDTIVG
jgi:DNA-directed RNA polymerase specialized sigma24 family protein